MQPLWPWPVCPLKILILLLRVQIRETLKKNLEKILFLEEVQITCSRNASNFCMSTASNGLQQLYKGAYFISYNKTNAVCNYSKIKHSHMHKLTFVSAPSNLLFSSKNSFSHFLFVSSTAFFISSLASSNILSLSCLASNNILSLSCLDSLNILPFSCSN